MRAQRPVSRQMARSGLLTATARLVAPGANVAATTAAGTPTALALQRFGHFNGAISRLATWQGDLCRGDLFQQPRPDRGHLRAWLIPSWFKSCQILN
jgi:hypothetical protein